MIQDSDREECARVRDALLSRSFEQVSREQVEQHLAAHAACVQWASKTLLVTHLLATGRARPEATGDIDDALLDAYVSGGLPERERRRIEDACCHDLGLARRLQSIREAQWRRRVRVLDAGTLSQITRAGAPREDESLSAPLHGFHRLYLDKPLAVAAAQTQRSTFQTPDGNFVVSVVDKGSPQPEGPHLLEIGLRAHHPKWLGRWACYRVTDARGYLAAGGLVTVEEHGSSVQVTVPPTEHAPYTVQVQILDVESSRLQSLFEQIVEESDSGTRT
jgi:hypothetical protein